MKEKMKEILKRKEIYINPWVNYVPKRGKKPKGYDLK